MTSYAKKAVCAKCGEVYIKPDYPGLHFKCEKCGFTKLFENQNVIVKKTIDTQGKDKVQILCNVCEGLLLYVGKEECLGYDIEIYQCDDCLKEYTVICYPDK